MKTGRTTGGKRMNRQKIEYSQLNARAKENFNAAKLASLMADYGYTCLRLSDDYNGADLIALRDGEDAMHIQLKSRLTVSKKYGGKGLYMAFPVADGWHVLPHDKLVQIASEHGYLGSKSWIEDGAYSTGKPSASLRHLLREYKL